MKLAAKFKMRNFFFQSSFFTFSLPQILVTQRIRREINFHVCVYVCVCGVCECVYGVVCAFWLEIGMRGFLLQSLLF
jgi:hypothetical protein